MAMRNLRHSARVVALVSLMLAASGPSRAAETKNDPTLAPAMLRLSDLPSNWSISDDPGLSEEGEALPPICGVVAPVPITRSARSFAKGPGTTVTSIVMRFKPGSAKAFLDALTPKLRKNCPQIIETGLEGNDAIEARYVHFALPKLGNQALGLRLANAEPFSSEIVLIRRGDHISVVTTGAILEPAPPATALAKKAAIRLASIR